MTTVKEIILNTDLESVVKDVKLHYGEEHINTVKNVYLKLKNMASKKNTSNMVIFIRVLKENARGDEDVVISEFDNNDNSLMFDVCGEDDYYDGLYSIASSDYSELLGYYVAQSTIDKFLNSQIIAHILWEIQW